MMKDYSFETCRGWYNWQLASRSKCSYSQAVSRPVCIVSATRLLIKMVKYCKPLCTDLLMMNDYSFETCRR